jgi:hypothetical protein
MARHAWRVSAGTRIKQLIDSRSDSVLLFVLTQALRLLC